MGSTTYFIVPVVVWSSTIPHDTARLSRRILLTFDHFEDQDVTLSITVSKVRQVIYGDHDTRI